MWHPFPLSPRSAPRRRHSLAPPPDWASELMRRRGWCVGGWIVKVEAEYRRSQNRITFDCSMGWRHMPALQFIMAPLSEEFLLEQRPPAPALGTVYIKPYGYQMLSSSFMFRTFLTMPEVSAAPTGVATRTR